jgi:hypothetical protein
MFSARAPCERASRFHRVPHARRRWLGRGDALLARRGAKSSWFIDCTLIALRAGQTRVSEHS